MLENPWGRKCASRQLGLAGPPGQAILLVGVSMQQRCATTGSDCRFGCQTSAFGQGVRRATRVITQKQSRPAEVWVLWEYAGRGRVWLFHRQNDKAGYGNDKNDNIHYVMDHNIM
jgi:hypothetical protein